MARPKQKAGSTDRTFEMDMRLETSRLLIRDLDPEDIPSLVGLWTDPEVTRHMGGPRDADELRRGLEADARAAPARIDLRTVVEKSSGKVIGHCGLLEKEVDGTPEIELVYVLAREVWGRGLATEAAGALRDHAFGQMGIRRLIALIDPVNIGSAKVAAKVGMTCEKTTLRSGGREMQVYALTNARPGIADAAEGQVAGGQRRGVDGSTLA